MKFIDKLDSNPRLISIHKRVTTFVENLTETLNKKTHKIFSPIGNGMMNYYLNLQPTSNLETVFFGLFGLSMFTLAIYINYAR